MAGPTSIGVNGRVEFQFSVTGIEHKLRLFCNYGTGGGGASGYTLLSNRGGSPTDFEVGAEQVWHLFINMFSATQALFGNALLYQYSGGAWVPIATYTTSTGPAGGSAQGGMQFNIMFYDGARKKVPIIFQEMSAPGVNRYPTIALLPSPFNTFATVMLNPSTPGDPGFWVHSRGGNRPTSYIAGTLSTNRKSRRRRGIA